jgi:Cu/Ag efflux protein CusF
MKRLSTLVSVLLALVVLVVWTPAVKADIDTDQQTATGTVKSVAAKQNQIVLTIKEQDQTFQLSTTAKVRVGDTDSKLADLKTGDKVTVTYRMQARAIRSAKGTFLRGQIKSIDTDKNELVLKDAKGKEHTLTLDKEAKVWLGSKESKTSDLKKGDRVMIAYAKSGDDLKAQQIRAYRGNQATRMARGEVTSIAAKKNQLVIKDDTGTERTFNLAKNAKVQVDDTDSKLADLKEGDQVNITYARMVSEVKADARE